MKQSGIITSHVSMSLWFKWNHSVHAHGRAIYVYLWVWYCSRTFQCVSYLNCTFRHIAAFIPSLSHILLTFVQLDVLLLSNTWFRILMPFLYIWVYYCSRIFDFPYRTIICIFCCVLFGKYNCHIRFISLFRYIPSCILMSVVHSVYYCFLMFDSPYITAICTFWCITTFIFLARVLYCLLCIERVTAFILSISYIPPPWVHLYIRPILPSYIRILINYCLL